MSATEQQLLPLVGVERVAAKPTAKILIVSGADACHGVQKLLPGTAVITWMGGVEATDWSPLKDRKVDIWLDAGGQTKYYAPMIANLALELGCKVRLLDDKGLKPPAGAFDAVTDQWSMQQIRDHCAPRWRIVEAPLPVPKRPTLVKKGQKPADDWMKSDPQTALPPPPVTSLYDRWSRWGIELNNGKPHSNAANIYKAIRGLNLDENLRIRWDAFLHRIVWREPRLQMEDNDIVVMQCKIQEECGLTKAQHRDVKVCIERVARDNPSNEARDWLTGLAWDGTDRLATLMSDAFGAPQNAYTAAVGRCFLMQMAKRILQPGAQADYVLVLEGDQGERKTSGLRALAGERWFIETHEEFGSHDFLVALQGKVLCEIGELSSFKGAKLERIKGIITRRVDTYRSKYGVWANDHYRTACFAGTTNEANYLSDPTGNRRYWPVQVCSVSLSYLTENRDQLWAEAYERVRQGESYWDVPAVDASEAQEMRREIVPWEEKLIPWLENRATPDVSMSDCLDHLGVSAKDETAAAKVVAPILRRAGWKRVQKWVGKSRIWVYRQQGAPAPLPLEDTRDAFAL